MIGEDIKEYYLSTLIIKSGKRKSNAWRKRTELSGQRQGNSIVVQISLGKSGNKQKSQPDYLSAISTGFGLIVDLEQQQHRRQN